MFRFGIALAIVTAAVIGGTALVAADPHPGASEPALTCSPAAIRDIKLPAKVQIDEIRAVVAGDSPAAGAARVTVEAGPFDRALSLIGPVSHRLSFWPALEASSFHVVIDPVLGAPDSVCVQRIELRSRGALVAAVQP